MSAASAQPADRLLERAIPRYFEVALYLLVLTGFLTLVSTHGLDTPSTLFVAAALIIRGYALTTNQALLIPERWTNALTIAYVAFYIVDYFLLSQQFVSTTVHLVLFLTVMRLFSARRDRDHYFLAVIAFLMVLASAVLTVDSAFLFAFAIFMLCAIATFILLEMKRTSAKSTVRAKEPNGGNGERRLVMSLAGTASAILLSILLAATAIFFVLPRLSTGYLTAFSPSGALSTGFSDHVELGNIGEIQQSNTVVMHIEITGDQRGTYTQKWRGAALSVFDGASWSNPHRAFPLRPGMNQQFDLRSREARLKSPLALGLSSQIHYHILMEPVGINIFFLAPQPQALQGKYRVIAMDRGGAVFDLDPEHPAGIYDGWSLRDASSSRPERVYTLDELSGYLQLPKLDPRVPELAAQISNTPVSDYDKAVAIERYLKTKFSYTLQLPSTHQPDPLANFLFERKQGHCEYFASAMAVMLRTIKIPSRVVTGFRTNEFNDITSQYIIRGSDAHAWVEAYFPDRGWVTFDPTPSSGASLQGRWGRISMYTDAMASFWREWVVNYDVAHQYNLTQQTAQMGRHVAYQVRGWFHNHYRQLLARAHKVADRISVSPGSWMVRIVLVIVALLFLFNLRRLWLSFQRFMLTTRPDKSPRMAASLWYGKMVRKVERKGWQKTEAQTPSEFAQSIQDEQLRRRVLVFTSHYEGARFGGSAEDAQELPELYEEVVSSCRAGTPARLPAASRRR
ncbi:MAG TPA: DUF3488 and transglutaminase-like domain-containing protein [Terriglobales bacterium]|nr:DUF3488 and transglutaminase-like domain-containing protein [Terriglobales bacterium]